MTMNRRRQASTPDGSGCVPPRGETRAPTGAPPYCRETDLAGLLPLWPGELSDESGAARDKLLVKLRAALRAERRRGAAGDWTYDLARHARLLAAYRAEKSARRKISSAETTPPSLQRQRAEAGA